MTSRVRLLGTMVVALVVAGCGSESAGTVVSPNPSSPAAVSASVGQPELAPAATVPTPTPTPTPVLIESASVSSTTLVEPATATETVSMIVDPEVLADLDGLLAVTDLVVTVTAVGAEPGVRLGDDPELPANKRGTGLVSEIVHARLDRTLVHTGGPAPTRVLRIQQDGGTIDGVRTEYSLPGLESGSSYLLFLLWDERRQVYRVAGLGQGRFPLGDDGQPLPTGGDDPSSTLRAGMDGLILDEIEELVSNS